MRHVPSSWLIGLTALLMSSPLLAQDKEIPSPASDLGPTLLQLAGALLLIIVIIYVSIWLMKKYSTGRMAGGGNLIAIVERRHLTPKQVLYLIKIGEKHLLIGASDSGLQKLSDIENLEIKKPQPSATSPVSKFSQALRQAKETLIPRTMIKEKSVEV